MPAVPKHRQPIINAAVTLFRRQGSGHVIMVSSIVGKRGVPYMGAYSATKFAQVGLAECLRSEVVGTGIHVSVVYPVSTETEFRSAMEKVQTPIAYQDADEFKAFWDRDAGILADAIKKIGRVEAK